MRFSICVIEPEGYRFSHFLYDLCKYLCFTIEALGHECCMVKNQFYDDRINIILGAHNLNNLKVAEHIKQAGKYVIVQSEVLRDGGIAGWPDQPSFSKIFVPLMQRACAVWHGVESNEEQLAKLGIDACRIPKVGYLRDLEEIRHKTYKDIDFLYFGSLTAHRKSLIETLTRRGGKVVCIFDEATIFRNDYIARTRVHLAPNQGPGINHITAKTLYLLNNRCVVAVERCHEQEWIEHCYLSADTEKWADLCMETLHRPDLDQLSNHFFERYKQLDMTALFQPLLDDLNHKTKGVSRAGEKPGAVERLHREVSEAEHQAGEKAHAETAAPVARLEALLKMPKPIAVITTFDNSRNYETSPEAMHNITVVPHIGENFVPGLTSIIILTHNQLEQTKKCVKSIRKHTPEAHEIFFIDNGSTDKTVRWLQSQVKENKNYRLIENKENVGPAKGRNQGIAASRGEYILLLESDVIVGTGWLSGLLACHRHAPDAGIVGPMSNNGIGLQQAPAASYQSVDYLDKLAEQFKNKHRNRRILSRKIAGFCMLFARPLVEKIGLLDENLGDIILPAEDFCWRSVLAEQRNYVAGDVFVHHYSTEAPCDRSNFNKKWALSMATPEGKKLAVLKAMELADTYHSKGQMDQAVETLVNCIKYAPDEPLIYFELARLFIEVKKYAEARDVVTSMPQAAQDAIKGLECAACAREGLGLDDEAAVLVEKMLSLHSQYPPAINLLGVLSYKKGDKEKAKEFFQQAIEADPGYGEAYTNLGVLYWGIEQREEAFGNLKKGFLLSPALPDASSLYYSVVSSLDRFSQAEDDFAEACRLHPQNKNLVFLYIDILIQQEKFDSAILRIQDALTTFGLDEGTLNAALAVRDRIGPLQIEKSGKKGTLSLCMIVKNEEKHLAKCLKSVRDVVDEMIIVDTGSTDKTKDIAKVFGAKLYDFPWTGDFSAARNESLAHATGDWVLILDADEVISSMDYPEIRELMRKDKPRPAAYSIVTRNYLDDSSILGWTPNKGEYPEESGRGWLPSPKVRLLSRRPDIYFTYPVHETLENSLVKAGVPIMPSKIVVHHYGKLAVADDLHKGELYYLLGLTKLESDPNNFNHILELARQALTLKRYEESIDLSLRLRDLAKTDAHARAFIRTNRPFNIDLEAEIYLLLSSAYLPLNRFAEALEVAKQAALISPDRKEIIQCYANCEVVSGSLDKAYQTLYELLMEAPDYPAAQLLLAIIFCLKGEHEKMENLFRILLSRGFSITDAMNLMAERYIIQNRNEEARLILHTIKKHKLGNIKTDELLDTTET